MRKHSFLSTSAPRRAGFNTHESKAKNVWTQHFAVELTGTKLFFNAAPICFFASEVLIRCSRCPRQKRSILTSMSIRAYTYSREAVATLSQETIIGCIASQASGVHCRNKRQDRCNCWGKTTAFASIPLWPCLTAGDCHRELIQRGLLMHGAPVIARHKAARLLQSSHATK